MEGTPKQFEGPQMEGPEGEENIEDNEAWRELKEEAPRQVAALLEDRLGNVEEASVAEKVDVLKQLIDEYAAGGNENRFIVEELSKHLSVSQMQLSLNQATQRLFGNSESEIQNAA